MPCSLNLPVTDLTALGFEHASLPAHYAACQPVLCADADVCGLVESAEVM